MICATVGGTGVGPAVIRYCLVKGFGVKAARRLASSVSAPLEVALQIVAEVIEVEPGEGQHDERDHRAESDHDPDAAQPQGHLRLPGPMHGLAAVDLADGAT